MKGNQNYQANIIDNIPKKHHISITHWYEPINMFLFPFSFFYTNRMIELLPEKYHFGEQRDYGYICTCLKLVLFAGYLLIECL